MLPPYGDLRSFLKVLESEHQLLRVSRQVRPEPDLGAAGRAAANPDGAAAPALVFDNIDAHENASVALNVRGSWAGGLCAPARHAGTSGDPPSPTRRRRPMSTPSRSGSIPAR